MKKAILAAVFIIAISGFAAAQSTSAKLAARQQKTIVKKVPSSKKNTTVLKQETSANAKSDSAVLLIMPAIKDLDTTALPRIKKEEEL